jgi:hypothetical protein
MARPKGARDRTPRRRRQKYHETVVASRDDGLVQATEKQAQVYQQAQHIVAALRGLPRELQEARPPRWGRGRAGLPALTPLVLKSLKQRGIPARFLTSSRISAAWRYVGLVERFAVLAPPVARNRVLAIDQVLALSPEAEHEPLVSALLTASYRQLQLAYQEAKRRSRPPRRRRHTPRQKGDLSPGGIWYERIVEVRQHLLWLKEEGLVENLALTWTAPNLSGYLSELQYVIQELTSVHARMKGVHKERITLRLVEHEEG